MLVPLLALALIVAVLAVPLVEAWRSGSGSLFAALPRGPNGVVANTAALVLGSALLGTACSWAAAHTVYHHEFPGRRLVHAALLAPLLMPPPAVALALVVLLGRNGLLTRAGPLQQVEVYGLPGLIAAVTVTYFPFAYRTVTYALRSQNRSLLLAAADLGASRLRLVTRHELPFLVPTLGVVLLVLALDALTDLAAPLVIGGRPVVWAERVYDAALAERDLAGAAVNALLMLLVAVVVALLVARFTKQEEQRRTGTAPDFRLHRTPPVGTARVGVALTWTLAPIHLVLLAAVLGRELAVWALLVTVLVATVTPGVVVLVQGRLDHLDPALPAQRPAAWEPGASGGGGPWCGRTCARWCSTRAAFARWARRGRCSSARPTWPRRSS